jgi:6-pyruvoyl-tetrahydropterin synthase
MPQLFVNRLTVIDFSYLHSRRGLVGESWQVDISLRGGLDEQGMVLDFGDVKKSVKRLIDEQFDHKLLVPGAYGGLTHKTLGEQTQLVFQTTDNALIRHGSPTDAVTLVDCDEITPETLAADIRNALGPLMPHNVAGIDIHLWPEPIEGAFYHYSHGLKQHCGNCQRIAHGHRSRLRIERNGGRDPTLESVWAEAWRDIYIGTREDVLEEKDGQLLFSYRSDQGNFSLQLPASRCYLIDTDSTVENIAQHIADTLKQRHPQDSFRVIAFEGIDKGAIGES